MEHVGSWQPVYSWGYTCLESEGADEASHPPSRPRRCGLTAARCFHYNETQPAFWEELPGESSVSPTKRGSSPAPWPERGGGATASTRTHLPTHHPPRSTQDMRPGDSQPGQTRTSLTRIQLLGGCTELGVFRDSVSDIWAFGRSPRGTETCCLCYPIRQVVKI